jgi:hypothetical protein
MDFASDCLRGPNNVPKPIAINATSVASTIINAIATYASILTPQNTQMWSMFVCASLHIRRSIS